MQFFFNFVPNVVVLPRPSRIDCALVRREIRTGTRFSERISISVRNSKAFEFRTPISFEIRTPICFGPQSGSFYRFSDTENSVVMVSSLVDRPLMTNEWSGVVKNLKVAEIRHVTYHFDRNFVLILKIILKNIGRGHLRSKKGKNHFFLFRNE